MNFGGGPDDEEVDESLPKSRKEIFEEIMAKSKAFKEVKSEIKTQNTNLTRELDDEYADLVQFMDLSRKRDVF